MKYHKNRVRKERVHKKGKLHQRILCIAVVLLMIISLQPQNMLLANMPEPVETEQNTEVPAGDNINQSDKLEPVEKTKEVPQENVSGEENEEESPETAETLPVEPRDYSALTEAIQLRISGVLFHENEKAKDNAQQVKTVDDRLDLSSFHVGEITDPKMEFSLVVPSVTKETSIHKGDYLQFDLPTALFKYIDETAVYALQEDGIALNTGEQVAEVVVDKNNKATITFLKDITEEYNRLHAAFTLPMTIDEAAVSTSKTIDMQLQKSETKAVNIQILLPNVQKEEPANETKEPVKEEQPEIDKAKEESKQEDSISPAEEQKQPQQLIEATQKDEKSLENRMQKFSTKTITNMFQLFANNPYRQIFTTGLPDGFESVKISILNKADGYTSNSSDKLVGFKFDVVLSDDFLLDELERITSVIPDAPIYTGNDKKYEEEMLEFLAKEETKKELIPLEYTFDLGDNFNNYSSKSHTDLMDEHNEKIGEYYVEKGIVHVVFESEMYFYSGVSAGFSFEAALDDDADLSDQPKDVEFDKGKLVLKETGSSSSGDQPTDAPKYSIDKDGPLSVDDPQITYTINLKSKNDTDKLNGKWLIDMIPSGMQVKSLYKVNGSTETLMNPNEYKIADVGGKKELRYQIKDNDNSKELAFKLILGLDADAYQNVVIKGSINQMFLNQASLREKEDDKDLVTSDTVQTTMKFSFLKKDGQQDALDGTKFNWTIVANTQLPIYEKGYLIDTFSYTDHKLASGSVITVQSKGKINKFAVDSLKRVNSTISFKSLSVEEIEKMAEGQEPFFYIYSTTEINPFYGMETDEPEYKQQIVLVLPFDEYRGVGQSEETKIQYQTELNLHDMDIDTYLSTYSENKDIGNIVNLLWRNTTGGIGPVPVPMDQVSFGKEVNTNVDVMTKRGLSYNPSTQKTIWNLEINRLGADLKASAGNQNLIVSDTFRKGTYDESSFAISYTEYDRNDTGKKTTGTLTSGEYSITDIAGGQRQLSFGVPELTNNLYRVYRLEAKLLDPETLSQEGSRTLENTAKIQAFVNGKPKETVTKAQLNIDNTLIEKEAVGGYDYKNHLFTWKVTVNPNKLKITDAKVIDTFEEHTKFKTLLSATADGTDIISNITINDSTVDSRNVTEFALGDISGKTVELTFTSELLNTDILSGMSESQMQFKNDVELQGIVSDGDTVTHDITNATDSAANVIRSNQMDKGGVYNAEDGSIAWTIYLNKDQVKMKDMVFVENLRVGLTADDNSIQDLDQDSIKIYTIGMHSDGSVDETNKTEITNQEKSNIVNINNDGFHWRITSDNRNTVKITFTTYLNEHAENATIENKVYLNDQTGDQVENSNESDGGYDGSFSFDDMAKKSPRPKVGIHKISSNSVVDNNINQDANHALNNAEFTMSAYTIQDMTGTWKLGTPIQSRTKINVSVDGKIYFLNMMVDASKNTIYELKETKAPSGYEKMNEPMYIYFVDKGENRPSNVNITVDGVEKKVTYITYGKDTDMEEIIVTNTPKDDAKFSFVKKIPDQVENGKIKSYKNAAKGMKFLLTPMGNFNVNGKLVETDANGRVTFDKVDPGKYTLTEVESTSNLDVGGSVTLDVKVNEEGKYTFALDEKSSHGLSVHKNLNSSYELRNDFVKGTVSFTKKVQYQKGKDGQIIQDNKEVLPGVKFTLKATGLGIANKGYQSEAISDKNGNVKFENIPVGDYILKEEAFEGYSVNSQEYKVTVTEKQGEELKVESGTDTFYGKTAEISITPDLSSDAGILYNTPVTGSLTFKKTVNNNGTGLEGMKILPAAEFGLYRKIGDQVAQEPMETKLSDTKGVVTFSDVEYGDYVIRELQAPDGFEKAAADIVVERKNITISNGSYHQSMKDVENKIITGGLTFHKIDQDQQPIQDVEFTLYRRSSNSITVSSSDVSLLQPNDTVKTYHDYLGKKFITDKDGNFTIKDLPLGDYLLVETKAPNDLQSGHDGEAIHIQLTQKNGKIQTVVLENENFEISKAPYTISSLDGWEERLPENDRYTIVNQKKYGYVQLHKQSGERQGNTWVRTDYSSVMNDVSFRIDRINGTNKEPYLILTTNDKGNFEVDDNGVYTGRDPHTKDSIQKHLYYGDYQITEVSNQNGYVEDGSSITFTINDSTTGHKGIAWIQNWTSNTDKTNVVYLESGKAALEGKDSTWINGYVRGQAELEKLGVNGEVLTDAVFEVKDGETAVASLRYHASTKKYVFSSKQALDEKKTYTAKKGSVPYLYEDEGVQKLLHGTYQVTEVTTPKGYQAASFSLTISSENGELTLRNPKNATIDGFQITDYPNVLVIQKQNKNGELLKNADFEILGTFADGTKTKTIEQANKGQLITGETYTIKEVKAPYGYAVAAKQPQFKFVADGKIEIVYSEDIISLKENKIFFTDEAIQITVTKTDGEGKSLQGAIFSLEGIFTDGDKKLDSTIKNLKVDKNGKVTLKGTDWNLVADELYTLTETKAPDGYQRDVQSITFKVQADGTISQGDSWSANYRIDKNGIIVKNTEISVLFTKQGNGAALEGVEFMITPVEGKTFLDGTVEPVKRVSDAKGGVDLAGLLKNGSSYHIHETQALPGYSYMNGQILHIDEDGKAYLNDQTDRKESFTLINEPLKTTVTKIDEDNKPVSGILFLLTEVGKNKTRKLVSSEDGILTDVENGKKLAELLSAERSYTLEEQPDTNSSYINLKGKVSFSVTRDGKLTEVKHHDNDIVSFDDHSLQIVNRKTMVSFEKQDRKGNAVKDATLALYQDVNGTPAKELMKLDEKELTWKTNGSAYTIERLPQGIYWLKEIETPTGYITAEPIQFQLDKTGAVIVLNQAGAVEGKTVRMIDEVVAGQILLKKQGTNGTALSDVQFDLYKEDGTLITKNLMTNEAGEWQSEGKDIKRLDDASRTLGQGLEAGTYYVLETKTQDGYQLPQGEQAKTVFTIEGKRKGSIVVQPDAKMIAMNNNVYKRTLSIMKQDEEDHSSIAGTRFSLQRMKDQDGKEVQEQAIEKSSNAEGLLDFKITNKGTYVLKEVASSKGYIIGEKPYETKFTATDASPKAIVLDDGNVITNQRDTGSMTLVKTDEDSKEVLNDTGFTLYKSDIAIGEFFTGYHYDKEKDGNWKKSGTKDGTLEIHGLVWGNYTISETKASDGYQLQNHTKDFTIGKNGTDMILEVNDIGFTNLQTEVIFTKLATYVERCSDETLGTAILPGDSTRPLSQAEFTAYDDKGNEFAKAISDKNGIVTFKKMLAGKTYTIKETKTPVGFVEHTNIYTVTIKDNGQAEELIDMAKKQPVAEVINDIVRTDIVLHKVSEQNPDKAISDSLYGLYRVSRARERTPQLQLVATARTDKDGKLRFQGVLMNQDYIIKELEAPAGSHLSEQPITIRYTQKNNKITIVKFEDGKGTAQIDKNGNIIWYEPDVMVNFTKTDEAGKALKGAQMELLDDNGKVIDRWTSEEIAHKTINLLTAGKRYTWREVKAPSGYALASDVIFTVVEKELGPGLNYVQEVVMKDQINTLTVEKKDKTSGSLIKGAEFEILAADSGELVEDKDGKAYSWTSSGKDIWEGIPEGTYLLHEKIAPNGYLMGENIIFTIDAYGDLYVNGVKEETLVMWNERKPEEPDKPQEETKKEESKKEESPKSEDDNKKQPSQKQEHNGIDTGDTSNQKMYILLLGISLFSLFCVSRKLYLFRKK